MLHVKYRPSSWSEVVGQDKAVSALRAIRFGGNAVWLQGQSGTGKTTLAYLYAQEHCEHACVEEYDAGELTPALIRDIERRLCVRGFGDGARAVIVNEAHGLRKDAIRALLVALERIPSHACWLFTTTCDGAESLFEEQIDGSPLLSRCIPVALARRDLAQAFAERARYIAQAEGMDGRPIADYLRLAKDCRNNLRMMLSRIEAGAMRTE